MRKCLKLGLISAVTAIALAQTPAATQAQTMDEDVLAIATQGALSDKMQGFRKLADDSVSIVKFNPVTKQEYSVYQGSNMIQALGQSLFPRVLNDGRGRGYIPERQRFFGI